MVDFLKLTVLKPGLERLGSLLAVWLMANLDASEPVATQIALGVCAAAGLAFDWVVIALNRKRGK